MPFLIKISVPSNSQKTVNLCWNITVLRHWKKRGKRYQFISFSCQKMSFSRNNTCCCCFFLKWFHTGNKRHYVFFRENFTDIKHEVCGKYQTGEDGICFGAGCYSWSSQIMVSISLGIVYLFIFIRIFRRRFSNSRIANLECKDERTKKKRGVRNR